KVDYNDSVAISAMNARLKNIRFQAKAGPAVIWVGYQHRSFAESEGELHHQDPRGGFGRILNVTGFQISGPFNASGIDATPSRAKIFSCYPESAAEQAPCAQEILSTIAQQAYRRP